MARKPTKAANNIYCQLRMAAAKFNDRLKSREGVYELGGIEQSRYARIELGSALPYPDEVLVLADLYNAPELCNYYCSRECPIGKGTVPEVGILHINDICIRLHNTFKDVAAIEDNLMSIAGREHFSDEDIAVLESVISSLSGIGELGTALRLWHEKAHGKEGMENG